MRFVVSFVLAFAVSAAVGRVLIPWLRALKAGQSIKEIGPVWHMSKQGTPTMGGVMFIVGILVAILARCLSTYSHWCSAPSVFLTTI